MFVIFINRVEVAKVLFIHGQQAMDKQPIIVMETDIQIASIL